MKVKQAIAALNKLAEQRTETVGHAWARKDIKITEDFYLVLPTCKSGYDYVYLDCAAGTTIARIASKITTFYNLLSALQDKDKLDHYAIAQFHDFSRWYYD